jgi:hypothetical protein
VRGDKGDGAVFEFKSIPREEYSGVSCATETVLVSHSRVSVGVMACVLEAVSSHNRSFSSTFKRSA